MNNTKVSTLYVFEKTNLLKDFEELRCDKLHDCHIIYSHMGLAPNFIYPKISYKDLPKSFPLKYGKLKREYSYTYKDGITKIWINPDYDKLQDSYDYIYLCTDNDSSGVFYANAVLDMFKPENLINTKIIYVNICEVLRKQKEYIIQNKKLPIDEEYQKTRNNFYKSALIKRYFDYNFNINSKVFFGEILHWLNINTEIVISKYMIYTLHFIHKNYLLDKIYQTGNLAYFMQKNNIGSPASICTIIDNLVNLSLIEYKKENNREYVHITENGEKFISRLTKRTYDNNIGNRINNWQNRVINDINEYSIIEKEIDTYIINFFKQQKAKNKHIKLIIKKK